MFCSHSTNIWRSRVEVRRYLSRTAVYCLQTVILKRSNDTLPQISSIYSRLRFVSFFPGTVYTMYTWVQKCRTRYIQMKPTNMWPLIARIQRLRYLMFRQAMKILLTRFAVSYSLELVYMTTAHISCNLSRINCNLHRVSKKFPPLNSLYLCQILTDFQNVCTWKAYEICYKTQSTLLTSP